MAGDGNFRWFYAAGEFPEIYEIGGNNLEETLAVARAGGLHHQGFRVVEADQVELNPDFFDADWLIEQYEERNEEAWNEDGYDGNPTPEQKRELEAMLCETFKAWCLKNNTAGRAWGMCEERFAQYYPPDPAIALAEGEA